MENLTGKIKALRKEMEASIDENGILHPQTIALSQELDVLIVEAQKEKVVQAQTE